MKTKSKFIFPKNTRFITERFHNRIVILVGLLSVVLLIMISFVGWDLYKNIQEKKRIEIERQQIISEIDFWQTVSKKYKGYRDAYFKLAVLEYKLGNDAKSQFYLSKTFALDPNFAKGRALEKSLESKK